MGSLESAFRSHITPPRTWSTLPSLPSPPILPLPAPVAPSSQPLPPFPMTYLLWQAVGDTIVACQGTGLPTSATDIMWCCRKAFCDRHRWLYGSHHHHKGGSQHWPVPMVSNRLDWQSDLLLDDIVLVMAHLEHEMLLIVPINGLNWLLLPKR